MINNKNPVFYWNIFYQRTPFFFSFFKRGNLRFMRDLRRKLDRNLEPRDGGTAVRPVDWRDF